MTGRALQAPRPHVGGATGTVRTTPARRRFGLLRERDFRLLWIGETTSSLGSSVTSVALPLVAVVVLHAGALGASLLTAATWLPWLVVGLPAGAWIDRLPRRPVMQACNLVSAALFGSIPAAWWLGVLGMPQLLAVALLTGTTSVFFKTAYQVYLPALLAPGDLVEGNAKLAGSQQVMQVVGPGIGGAIAQSVGAALGLLADAASFLVSAACLSRIRGTEPPPAPTRARTTLRREIAVGLRFVLRDRYLRPMTLTGAAANLAMTGYQAITIVFLVRTVGASPGTVGLLLAGTSLGGVAGAFLARPAAHRLGAARAMLVCQAGAAPFGLLLPLATRGAGLLPFVAGSLVVIAGTIAGNVVRAPFRANYCPPELLGRATATSSVVNFGSIPLGALLGGTLATAVGPRLTIAVMAGLLVLAQMIQLTSPLRHLRDFPTRQDPLVDVTWPVGADVR